MASRLRLGSTAIYARDRRRLVSFYQSIFDMKLRNSDEDREVSKLAFEGDDGAYDLSIVGKPLAVQNVFHADSLIVMKELWEKVQSYVIPARGLYVRHEGVFFHFPDPEGNQIVVLWPHDLLDEDGTVDDSKIHDDEMARWIRDHRKSGLQDGLY
jgi:predicted enzyme related to lactoylglutathione lyase